MKKEEVFIYKITTNKDWYFLLNSTEFHYPCIYCYDDFKEDVINDLNEFPSKEDFEVFKSSTSAKEKLIHYIISWYCPYNGLLLINDKDVVYFIVDEKLEEVGLQLLSKNETDELLNSIITDLNLETAFNETQKYYLEHDDEITKKLKQIEEYYNSSPLLHTLYKESERYGFMLDRINEN